MVTARRSGADHDETYAATGRLWRSPPQETNMNERRTQSLRLLAGVMLGVVALAAQAKPQQPTADAVLAWNALATDAMVAFAAAQPPGVPPYREARIYAMAFAAIVLGAGAAPSGAPAAGFADDLSVFRERPFSVLARAECPLGCGGRAEGFMAGTMTGADAVAAMTDAYARVAALWDTARATARRDAA